VTPRQAVAAEAMTWLGTPYHPHARVKGGGVDCAMLLAEVFERAGVVPHVDPGFYAIDWHLHRSEELFLDWLQRAGAREIAQPRLGDVCVYRFGRTYSHGAIVVSDDGLLIHALRDSGRVALGRETEAPLAGRPRLAFSLWSDA